MKVKHTPAPWPMKRREVTAPTGEVYQHFEIGEGWKDGRYLCVSGCIDEADARLISAAPELLNAAEQALSDLKWVEAQDKRNNMQASIILLRHAIAKATGEQE